ncbi:glycosyltransferase family 2 protein [Jejuia pallidilutea]|uniref:Probable two-domain glycosyltransferase n=1 Tax=Jejuia pallidilutea TaxID=504487 RepID=A0A090VT79_9FLAO|nr:glycosyltransferase family 2 protein [Jejuia pallidilutea]GAL67930.1 probable two-domain glycosyltransferase [Jejuia pallidilutea]GAL72227.1 probable two-domain glycosyltransferase [Jejuia pallidilutea]GAL89319.1 probable two-domain glycosyltransferase [Jejuia pallidilutea]
MSAIEVSVIISTYNKPAYLEKVLWSYQFQTFKNFEVVIADDGSTDDTKMLIKKIAKKVNYSIQHVWQPDDGFQKTKILNKATVAAKAKYLIYTDGDCVARNDFISTHIALRHNGIALSGGYFKLTESVSRKITLDVIASQVCFSAYWLLQNGQPKSFKMNKLSASKIKTTILNVITPTKATFDGMNVSAWKQDILAVNGFDERMEYGGEDRELGERLMNYGIKFKQIRYSAVCLHLYHERPYRRKDILTKNKIIRAATKKQRSVFTAYGIVKPNN